MTNTHLEKGIIILFTVFLCCFAHPLAAQIQLLTDDLAGITDTVDPAATAESLGLQPYTMPDGFFPLLMWDWVPKEVKPYETLDNTLQGITDCGFNLPGFVVPKDLARCDKLKLKVIVSPEKPTFHFGYPWKELTDEQIDKKVKDLVEQSKGHDCVVGYFLEDEPFPTTFEALSKAVAAVKKYAPGKLAYINLNPSYSFHTKAGYAKYLELYVQTVKPQFLSYDNYSISYSDNLREPYAAANYFSNLLQIREIALKYKLPFWNILATNQLRYWLAPPTPAEFAFQAYTTLAAGGRGISWFRYYSLPKDNQAHMSRSYFPIDRQGRKTVTWQYLQAVNKHILTLGPIMNRLESVGVYFSSPVLTRETPGFSGITVLEEENYPVLEAGSPSGHLLPGKFIKSIQTTASVRGNNNETPVFMIGEFSGADGCNYAMLVNLSLEYAARFHIETVNPYAKIEWISPLDGLPTPLVTGESDEWVLPGHGILLKMAK
jgi:hypothetical protein